MTVGHKEIADTPYEAVAALISYSSEPLSSNDAKGNPVDWVEDALEQLHDKGSEYVVTSETVADFLDSGWAATYSDYFNGVKVVCMTKNRKDAAIVDCGDKRIVRVFE